MGRITDRLGIVPAMAVSIAFLTGSYVLAGLTTALWQFIVISFLMGLGTSATFAPLMAEASHWFERYRGLAVTIVACRQLYRGHVLAAADQLEHAGLWLARHPFRHRHCLRRVDDDPAAGAAPGHGRQRGARSRQRAAAAGRSQAVGQYADGVAVHRQHLLLRGDVDAAGSHRVLLRRPRLWRRARRGNAVDHDGFRHRQPHRLGISGRQVRRHGHADDRIGGAGRLRCSSTCSSPACRRSI